MFYFRKNLLHLKDVTEIEKISITINNKKENLDFCAGSIIKILTN